MKKGLTRRDFVKSIAITAASGVTCSSLAQQQLQNDASGEDTGVNPPMNSGIPLGGIGCGTVEIRADGNFHDWQIFNNWASDLQFDDSFFAAWVKQDGKSSAHMLQLNARGAAPGVKSIAYVGEHPFAFLKYMEPESPVKIELKAWTPFIPHDSKNSGIPACVFSFSVENTDDKPAEVSLMASQRNGTGYDTGYKGARNRKATHSHGVRVIMDANSGGTLSSMAKPVKLLMISDEEHPEFQQTLTGITNLHITWATGKGVNGIKLPAANGAELARKFDCAWMGETAHASETLGDANMTILKDAVSHGMGFLYSGGWDAFYGISDERWGHLNGSVLESFLPVTFENHFDVNNENIQMTKSNNDTAAQVFGDIHLPQFTGYNNIASVKSDGVIIAAGNNGQPLIITGTYGAGRTLVYATAIWGGWPSSAGDVLPDLYAKMIAYAGKTTFNTGTGLPAGWSTFGSMTLNGMGEGSARADWNNFEELWADFVNDGRLEASGALDNSSIHNAAITQSRTIKPGEKTDITFLLTWFYPNHIDADRTRIGHMYSNWFSSANNVADYVTSHLKILQQKTERFHKDFYESSLERKVLDAINAQLTTFTKETWWTKANKFSVWEGEGCCGLDTTDVGYYGSHVILLMFPDLEKSQIDLTMDFQLKNGHIPHFFPSTFDHPDSFYRIDLMPQYVLMVYRDWKWLGDSAFLNMHWPHVMLALTNMHNRDTDGDDLPNDTGADQTYDQWGFFGTSVYVSSLYLVAVKAAMEMAMAVHDETNRKILTDWFDKGQTNFEKELWNGEYYDLYFDPKTGKRSNASLAAGMDSVWYAQLIPDLGNPLPADQVLSSLNVIYTKNRRSRSIINGWWPDPTQAPDHPGQWSAVWTGVEYSLASNMIYAGMVEEGLQIIRDVQDRYLKWGKPWNHMECGNHYYRPMSVWTAYMAAQGFSYDANTKQIGFEPRVSPNSHQSVFCTPQVWGIFSQTKKEVRLTIRQGALPLQSLLTNLASEDGKWEILHNKTALHAEPEQKEKQTVLRFQKPIVLKSGDTLTIRNG
jgi:uncharacterized protein (DUF608 family)